MSGDARRQALTTDLLMRGYASGVFPMAEARDDDTLYWVEPRFRGILPLDGFHLPRRLARTVRTTPFDVRVDCDFGAVVAGCAAARPGRDETWINRTIEELYCALHREGRAHSVEVWDGETLAGGLYGVRLGAAFFGESMFSRARDASKIALVHLIARLRAGGFRLLDTQFITSHLSQFGATEVARDHYRATLTDAIAAEADFFALPLGSSGHDAVQRATQTS